jgi:nucleoside-diphosphate-sugar epimerase
MKRVLVTGASGFIGRHSLIPLLDKGYEVHAIFTSQPIEVDSRVQWHHANLLKNDAARELCAKINPTHLLHFAWHVDPKDYKTSPINDDWHVATLSLLKAFKENGGERAVLAGSAMEYDPTLSDHFLTEDAPTADHNAYAKAKNETRREAAEFAAKENISLAWGRIFNLFGPYEARERLVPQIITSFLEEKMPNIAAGGLVLDYSYVKDIASAFVALLESEVSAVVNIGSGEPISLKEMALSIARLLHKGELAKNLNEKMPQEGPKRVVADVSHFRDKVGWKPSYDLQRGLIETIEWWKNQ